MRVAESGNVKGVLTCWTSHWVSGQYTHRITISPLCFAVKVFRRYCLNEANIGVPNRNAASIWSYVLPLTCWGGGIRSVFPQKAFANSEITILSLVWFGQPVSATPEGDYHNCLNDDISRSIEVGPRIFGTDIKRIHRQWRPKGLVLPVVVACMEATSVNLSLSPI
jgi:hypothetical protein